MKVSRDSRLAFSRLINDNGLRFFEAPNLPEIQPADDDIIHVVTGGDRLDKISDTYYGRPDFIFIIALANGMEIYPNDLSIDDKLRIPSPTRVENEILPKSSRGRQGRTR